MLSLIKKLRPHVFRVAEEAGYVLLLVEGSMAASKRVYKRENTRSLIWVLGRPRPVNNQHSIHGRNDVNADGCPESLSPWLWFSLKFRGRPNTTVM